MPAEDGRVGIMQPYFFPYLGYFALIASVDRWVVFDVTRYSPKTWMNRNRVLHPQSGWMYVTAPVRGASQSCRIDEVMLDDPDAALASLRGKLAHYRKRAPFFSDVLSVVERGFLHRASDSLRDLDVACIAAVCEYLGIPFEHQICSRLGLDLGGIEHAGQWALAIAQQLGASVYVNPPGGVSLFRPEEFAAAGIGLGFLAMPPMIYDTGPFEFAPSLSILDVLMWNPPIDVRNYVSTHASVVAPEALNA
jgi:hypothetical protein